MKIVKKIIVWAMLSVMIQATVLIYIDKVYFKHSSDFVFTEVKDTDSSPNKEIEIPKGVENLEVSYDGKYATYKLDNKFYLADIKEGEIKEIITDDDETEVLYSAWLLDSNRITIVEKKIDDSGEPIVNAINYNPKLNSSNQLANICSYSQNIKIDNIQTNTRSGVTYIAVSKGGHNSSIYRVDINDKLKNLGTKITTLGGMKVFPHKDVLIYKDKTNQKFYDYTNGIISTINFPSPENLELLAVDNNNRIFIGELLNGKVKSVKIGTLDTDISTWETIELEKERDIQDVYINNLGEVLVNDKLEGKIKNLITQKEVEYRGKLVELNNKIIASMDNGKLYITSLS